MKEVIVHIAETKDFSPEVISALQSFATVSQKDISGDDLKDALDNCDVFWFRLAFRIKREDLSAKPRCKFIVCPVTGLDHIDVQACAEKGIKVLSLKGETEFLKSVRATAEHTLGLTLALLRNISLASASVNNGMWDRNLFKGHEIYEKKVGIHGVGRLGTIVAGIFKGFGARVYGNDIRAFDSSVCDNVPDVRELYKMADIVSIHVSYNDKTHHLVGQELLSLMKPGAILINTSRGGVVNSGALVRALESGVISGAAVDVIEDEYTPSNNVLIQYACRAKNLLITPHIGGNTYESFLKTELFLLEKLRRELNIDTRPI